VICETTQESAVPKYFGKFSVTQGGTGFSFDQNPIEEDELKEYDKIVSLIIDLRVFMLGYECARQNWTALGQAMDGLRQQILSAHFATSPVDFSLDTLITMNQHIVNYIISSRTFIEHSESHIKRTYGETSQQYLELKAEQSRFYDSHFSYRFNYILRNYIVHRDLPISRAEISITRSSTCNDDFTATPVFVINLLDMFNNHVKKKYTKPVRNEFFAKCEELKARNYELDILPVLADQETWNKELFRWMVMYERERIIECASYMNVLAKMLWDGFQIGENEVPVIWETRDDFRPGDKIGADQRVSLRQHPIPFAELTRLQRLLTE
jgi:hypothetical protein